MLARSGSPCYKKGMNKMTADKRATILGMMAEGLSVRSICRLSGASKNTVIKLLADAGAAFAEYHHNHVRNVNSKRVQADEIWSFVGMKEKQAKRKGKERPKGVGDIWTWTAIDADSKLCVSWLVGGRDAGYAYEFMTDVASRLTSRVQLTTDGHSPYLSAVPGAFGLEVDYAQLIKQYGEDPNAEHRYSPPICTGCEVNRVIGFPEPEHISTSYVERQNLSMRMGMRRFTRLTNAFSKKAENHMHAISIYFMHYNWVRVHQTLRVTPAMEAGLTDKLWTLADMVAVLEEWESRQPKEKVGRKVGQKDARPRAARKSN